MIIRSVQTSTARSTTASSTTQKVEKIRRHRFSGFLHSNVFKHVVLVLCSAVLLGSSLIASHNQPSALAANPGSGNGCSWYRVQRGDTLTRIALNHRTTIWTLAQVNYIRNVNLIIVGQELCIPYRLSRGSGNSGGMGASGILSNGVVRWYDYSALDWSNRGEVSALLREVAARYGLPANLLLAIAWEESGWTQHVIAWDGGIGVMQLMPLTAQGINAGTGVRRDPYHLWDNLNLGATYLSWLWHNFRGNLDEVISGYNEGGWAVIHRGIFNWRYVDNVLSLMRGFR